jgi:hypothetical protein
MDCQYFKELFLNIPLNEDLDSLEKQQYYISFSHKVKSVLTPKGPRVFFSNDAPNLPFLA